jgi:L-lactate utilization protein LutC
MADKESSKKGFFGKLMDVITGNPIDSPQNIEEIGQFAPKEKEAIDVRFVEQLTQNGGYFVYCGTKKELIESFNLITEEHHLEAVGTPDQNLMSFLKTNGVNNLSDNLKECDTICTYCEALIAYNGGIMINEHQTKSVRIDDMPKNHIVIGKTSQLVENLHGAMSRVNQQYRDNRPGQISVLKGMNDQQVKLASADPNKNRLLFLLLIEDSF